MCRFLYVCVSMCVCVCVKLYKRRGFVYSPVGGGSAGQTVVCCRLPLLPRDFNNCPAIYVTIFTMFFNNCTVLFHRFLQLFLSLAFLSLSSFVVVVVVVAVALFHLAANYL